MDIMTWYLHTVGEASVNAVANRCKINQSTLNRQLRAGRLEPALVVPIARAYGRNVLDALVIQGLLTKEDVEEAAKSGALSQATDEEIADEVYRRLAPDKVHRVFDIPSTSEAAEVVSIPVPPSRDESNVPDLNDQAIIDMLAAASPSISPDEDLELRNAEP